MHSNLNLHLLEIQSAIQISNTALASRAGVSRGTLINWQQGKTIPRLPELKAVLDALNASDEQRAQAFRLVDAPRAKRQLMAAAAASASIPAPNGGDLLRAMRRRRGWTQHQAAVGIGVRQTTLARWERAECWPSSEALEQACLTLGGRPQEIAALASGRFELNAWPSEDHGQNPSSNVVEARLEWVTNETDLPELFPLKELFFMSLSGQAIQLSHQAPNNSELLQRVMTAHATFYSRNERHAEAAVHAEYAAKFLPRSSGRVTKVMANNIIMRIRGKIYATRQPAFTIGRALLAPLLDAPLHLADQSRFQSEMAYYEDRCGNMAQAIACSERSCSLASRLDSPIDIVRRRIDLAYILMNAGLPHKSLDISWNANDNCFISPYDRVSTLLCRGQALLQLNSNADADVELTLAQNLLEQFPMPAMSSQLASLTNRAA